MTRTAFVWVDGRHRDVPLVPMDVSVGWGKEAMVRLLRAVVRYSCQVTDSFTLASISREGDPRLLDERMRPHFSVDFRVFIPEPYLEWFRADVKPQEMRPPPRVHLNSVGTTEGTNHE